MLGLSLSLNARRRSLDHSHRGWVSVWVVPFLYLMSASVRAASVPSSGLQDVVISVSPLPGLMIDASKIPSNLHALDVSDLTRQGFASVSDALNGELASVSINDNLDNRFQPDILYRGFEASPVLGTPQGLAVYQNGVRVNEAFGDVVNWDLIPDVAVDHLEVTSANPLYGLNALGGAVIMSMKDGYHYQGTESQLSVGSFGGHTMTVQTGGHQQAVAWYVAASGSDEVGWRDQADTVVRQMYAVTNYHADRWSADLSLTFADNRLSAYGATPVQMLAQTRSSVFTGPQWNENHLLFSVMHVEFTPTPTMALQSVGYVRHFMQDISNGNTTADTACLPDELIGTLCQADGLTPLRSTQGAFIPDLSSGGRVLIGENNAVSIASLGHGLSLQMTERAKLFSLSNQLAVGVAVDDAHVDYRASTQIGVLNPLRFVDPSPWYVQTPEASPWTATPIALVSQNRDYGIYVLDVIDLSSALSLTGSARYHVARRDLLDLRGTLLTGHNRYSHLNPAVGASYQLTPALNAYVGWSENSRTPTASEIECSDPTHPCLLPSSLAADPPTLRQVIARSIEAGLRGRVRLTERARLDWNAGIFKTDVHDDIYGVATSLSTGFFTNIALTRREGFEAGLKYSDDRWSASVQWSDLRATFQSPFTVSSPSNPYRSENDTIAVVPGNELPGIARTRLKYSVSYQLNKRLDVGVMVSFVGGSYYRGDESNQNAKLPGFQLVNVHASYRMSEQLQGYLMVNNVLNKRYANFGLFGDPTGVGAPGVPETGYVDPRFQSPGSPFALTAGVRFTF